MLPLIGLLSSVVPEAVKLFSGQDSKATKAVNIASGLVKKLAGTDDEAQAVDIVGASPELQLELRKALMADSHWAENMAYQNTFDARDMYKKTAHEAADRIAQRVMAYNLPYVAGLAVANVCIIVFTPNEYMPAVAGVSNLIGIVIQSLLKERQDVVNFHFGSSVGSKIKDHGGSRG